MITTQSVGAYLYTRIACCKESDNGLDGHPHGKEIRQFVIEAYVLMAGKIWEYERWWI